MKAYSRFNPFSILRSQRGVALLIALMAMTLMTFIAVEVSYDTSVDYVVASQQVNRIRAYYAAKSGVELSLLRIMLYKQVMAQVGDSLGENKSMLDPIWNFPFMWPPTAAGTDDLMETDKDAMKAAVGEALMKAQYATTISAESGRLDINDLGSEIKSFREAIMAQVLKIFQAEVQNNDAFRRRHAGVRFEELVNNIADYIDEDQESLNGGDERAPYRDLEDKDIVMPPNRGLRTVDELHQVAGMTDEFYAILAPRITVFGSKGINLNYAGREMIKALDINMTDEAVGKIMARRDDPNLGGPYKDDKDFFAYAQPLGVNVKAIEDSKIPLLFDMEYNFRIVSTGISGNVKREITAITYDFPNLKTRLAEMLDKEEPDKGPAGEDKKTDPQDTGKPAGDDKKPVETKAKIEATKARPTVVYWEEN